MTFVIPNPFLDVEEQNLSSEQDPTDEVLYELEQMPINENPFDDKFILQYCSNEKQLIFEIFESPLERAGFDDDAHVLNLGTTKGNIETKIEVSEEKSFKQNKVHAKKVETINDFYNDIESSNKVKGNDKVVTDIESEWSSSSELRSEDEEDVVVQTVSSLSQYISRTWKRILIVFKSPKA